MSHKQHFTTVTNEKHFNLPLGFLRTLGYPMCERRVILNHKNPDVRNVTHQPGLKGSTCNLCISISLGEGGQARNRGITTLTSRLTLTGLFPASNIRHDVSATDQVNNIHLETLKEYIFFSRICYSIFFCQSNLLYSFT